MRVLVTGGAGFLGSYILKVFEELGYIIDTLGRSKENTIVEDISKPIRPIKKEYDLVLHAAGKAHIIPENEKERNAFFDVNHKGTLHLLNALTIKPKYFIFISTVSVYGLDYGENIQETAQLKATDPYGKSKILAEQEILSWAEKNKVLTTILRIPLLFGYKAPGNLNAMIKGIDRGYYFNIGNKIVRKSMVFAEDVINFIPIVYSKGGIYNLTDGYHPSFKELSIKISSFFGKSKPITLNYYLVLFLATLGTTIQKIFKIKLPINRRQFIKMTRSLTFNDSKARKIGWKPNKILLNTDKWLQ